MGGAVSSGRDNGDLVTKLCDAGYIRSPQIEFVLRSVDRGLYYPDNVQNKNEAYQDRAYKNDNIHLSAPCIYCEVLESLNLKQGLSFLNIGSGTGYLSTVAGLILGVYGTNHGVELHEEMVKYSQVKLQRFVSTMMPNILGFELCEPVFVNGNGYNLNPCYRQYDRVYCGAAVDSDYEDYIKSLVKVGGVLIMPVNDGLQKVCKLSETEFEYTELLPVLFASMVITKSCKELETQIEIASNPVSLQALCRVYIRRSLGVKNLRKLTTLNLRLPELLLQYLVYK